MIAYPAIGPTIFSIGPLSVRWYGLMYVLGYICAYLYLKHRVTRGLIRLTMEDIESLLVHFVVGMLIGARLTYVVVYNWPVFSENPIEIFKIWQGGLSFHGAAIGMCVAAWIFARKKKLRFYELTDALAGGCGPGLFFGRIGNFINGELYGRQTDVPWAMIFPTDPKQLPRHPSQLYQGLTEGLFLFIVLWVIQETLLRKKKFRWGIIGPSFLIGYGLLRFLTEFTREPDAQLGFILGDLSMGQLLCLLMVALGCFTMWHASTVEKVFEPKPLKL